MALSYANALEHQPAHPALDTPTAKLASYGLFLSGNTLVLSSMWALGVTGTYLGDYFGILMDAPVTSFPFNITDAPMYHGSTLSFLATALYKGKPAGIALTGIVATAYAIARQYEEYVDTELEELGKCIANSVSSPFTTEIYAKRDREQKAGKKTT